MFDKKIILLISLLLVSGSSYFIFHRKKDNNDKVNFVDNSDNSINEEESINEDNGDNEAAESNSSFLKYSFLFIIIVIIAIILFFVVKKNVNNEKKKKKKIKNTWDYGIHDGELEENNKNLKEIDDIKNNEEDEEEIEEEEVIIGEIEQENKIFKEYNEFKKIQKNKEIIEKQFNNDTIKKLVELFEADVENEYNDFLQKNQGKIKPDNYIKNRYVIDFYYHFTNDEVENPPKKNDSNLMFYRFNVKEHGKLLEKIIFNFFEEVKNNGSYKNIGDSVDKNIVFIFMATIIEPFFESITKQEYNKNVFIFNFQENGGALGLKTFFILLTSKMKEKEIGEIYSFFNYTLVFYAPLFNRLIKTYFPVGFALKKAVENNN